VYEKTTLVYGELKIIRESNLRKGIHVSFW